jgi:shikimate kinase
MPVYNKIIVLVGMMGAGKTRVGGDLAKLMRLPFIDSDREIERAANSSVVEIFEKHGEAEFRLREHQVLERLLDGTACVLASGGGSFIQPQIRSAIKKKAISVWLKTDIDILVERISRNNNRPMVRGADVRGKIEHLMAAREHIYGEADITVVTDGQTPQNTARLIIAEIDKLLHD